MPACPICTSSRTVKNGRIHNGKQRFKCQEFGTFETAFRFCDITRRKLYCNCWYRFLKRMTRGQPIFVFLVDILILGSCGLKYKMKKLVIY